MSTVDGSGIDKKAKVRKLRKAKKNTGGRNSQGRISVRHRGGGAKRQVRIVDFKRDKFDVPAKITSVEYDPNRSANIALLNYADGDKRYILAPANLKKGEEVLSSRKRIEIKPGNSMPLEYITVGSLIHNIELTPGKGAEIVRSAGGWAKLMAVEGKYAQIKLPSSEIRLVPKQCLATIGQVSNPEHIRIKIGKAGRKRHMGIRPTVRGKSMNPVDHPHGGGEGGCPIGMKHPKTPWGKPAFGVMTRKKNRTSDRLIISRRKNKKKRN